MKFGADILAPDSHQDSFWLQMSGGGRSAWHTGAYRSWGWSLDSPEATAPAGESRVSFWGREPIRVRGFQLRQGGAHCQFLVPPRSGEPFEGLTWLYGLGILCRATIYSISKIVYIYIYYT